MSTSKVILIRNAAKTDFGGGERFPVFLAQELEKKNLNPIIISRSRKLLDFAKNKNIKTIRGWWLPWQKWNGWKLLLLPIFLLWQVLLFFYYLVVFIKINPGIIHIQSKDDFIAGTLAAKILRKKIIWTDHADLKHIWLNITVWYKNPIGKIIYWCGFLANHITVVSKSEMNLVTKNLPRNSRLKNKIIIIYNGVIDSKKHFPRKRKDETVVFCAASRLVVDKGIGELIAAFKKLYKDHKNIKLQLLGDGPDRKIFDTDNEEFPIEFLGYQTEPFGFLAQADVFVHPTYHEGFSVALVEASMLALPIIATDVGGNPEIISNNKTGILIHTKDTDDLYRAMKLLLENQKLRKMISKSARKQFLEKFEFSTIVEKYFLKLYNINQ